MDIRGNNYTRGKKHVLAPVLVRASKYIMNHNAIITTKQLSESSRPDLQQSKVLETKKQKDKNKKAKKKKKRWVELFVHRCASSSPQTWLFGAEQKTDFLGRF